MRNLHGAHHKMLASAYIPSALEPANNCVAGVQKTFEQQLPTEIGKLRIIHNTCEVTSRPLVKCGMGELYAAA